MIFAVSVTANRSTRRGAENYSCATFVCAANKNEAQGMAIESARHVFPADQGWHGHQASVVQIPQEHIIAEARALVRSARQREA
jgi:hypothetical protein